jgi:Protein of unknown function (DUF2802)
MSHITLGSSIEILFIAARAVALLAAFSTLAWAFSRWRRAAIHDTQRVFEQLDLVRADLLIMKEAMNHSSNRTTNRNDRMQDDVRLPALAPTSNARGYEIAVRMARSGAHKEELIRSCGITNHEAELLIKLHRRDQATPTMSGRQVRPSINTLRSGSRGSLGDESVEQRFDREADQDPMRAALAKDSALKTSMQKSRLMAVG